MFEDDQSQKGAGAPQNLPVGEPEDIFSDEPSKEPVQVPPSALSTGALKPRQPIAPLAPASPPSIQLSSPLPPPPVDDMSQASAGGPTGYPLSEPKLSRYIMIIGLIIVSMAILGGGIWFLYVSFVREQVPVATENTDQENTLPSPSEDVIPPQEGEIDATEDVGDDTILFGEPVDLDGDGLEASRETALGTDPNNWDTDRDGLSDYDEVTVWVTDPLNQDTDGDGYTDGDEVKNGYSPSGPGKIFEPPAP